MADIKNTQELVALITAVAKTVKDANADGSVDANDLTSLIQIFPTLGPAIAGITDIPAELKDLDEDEITQLGNSVKEFVGDVVGGKYEEIAERSLKAGVEIFEIVKLLQA